MVKIILNGVLAEVEAQGEMPLLWALRDELGLTGTKYGCGIGACGGFARGYRYMVPQVALDG